MTNLIKIIAVGALLLAGTAVQAQELRGSIASEAAGGSDWSGFYLGVGVSYTSYEDVDQRFDRDNGFPVVFTGGTPGFVSTGDDLALSIHVGYNAQFDNVVVGVEADFINLSSTFKIAPSISTDGPLNIRVNDLMSARLRVGYDLGRFLPFATAGVAYASTNITGLEGYGMVGGVGVDYKVTENVIFGVSYLRYEFSDFGGEPVEVEADLFKAQFSARF